MTLSQFSFLAAESIDRNPFRKASPRRPPIQIEPMLLSSCQSPHPSTLNLPSAHLFDTLYVIDVNLAESLTPSNHITAQSIPSCDPIPWERLTSNPGPMSRKRPCYSQPGSIPSQGICTSTPQSMTCSQVSCTSYDSYITALPDARELCADNPPRSHSLKRKYTDLLGEEWSWSCGKYGCVSKADCKHTSELRILGDDDVAPEAAPDCSLPKVKEARLESWESPSSVVYQGNKAMSRNEAMESLLEMEEGDLPHSPVKSWW